MTCPCTLSDHEYDREGSYEELNRQYEDEKKSKQQEIINNSKGRKCKFHMRWDEKTQKWEHTYDPINCLNAYCFEPVCRITGKPKSKDKGNIYYDIVHEGRDYSKDGTFFEGERFKSILKDNQYFPKPVPLDIAQEIVRMKTKWIEDRAIENDRSFPALTKYRARKGEIDLTIKVENIRAVKKVARDIDDDLEAARQGVRVTYAKDEEEKKKTEKKERREKATADLKNKIKRKIVEAGLKNLNEADKRKAVKILTLTEITSAQREYEKRQIDDKKKPQQLSLFDLTKED